MDVIPKDIRPMCQVEGCKNGAQLAAKKGDNITWMKTCRRHNYQDLLEEKEKQIPETFWPPENK
jgi:hypothetical protein